MRLVFVSDSFIPKCPRELLWLVQAHRPVFGSVKLAPIKCEKSFVPRHMKSDERLFWKSTDHSAITLSINGIDVSKRGPSFWKFSCSLVNDNNYCDLFDTNIKSWLEEFKDVVDKRVLWDLLKYKIRQLTINYSDSICLSRVEGRGSRVPCRGRGYHVEKERKTNTESIFLSRVEGRGFHVDGNIFFSKFFFFGKGNNQCNQCH